MCAVSTWQWVVEVGIPSRLHIITTREADSTEQNPRLGQHHKNQNSIDRWRHLGVTGVSLVPTVVTTRLPSTTSPTI